MSCCSTCLEFEGENNLSCLVIDASRSPMFSASENELNELPNSKPRASIWAFRSGNVMKHYLGNLDNKNNDTWHKKLSVLDTEHRDKSFMDKKF